MYVTYSDLIQIGIFIVGLIGLIYEIFKKKISPATTTNSDGWSRKRLSLKIMGRPCVSGFPFHS